MNLAYRTALMSGVASPSLSLDFTSGVLDPRITFSRASNAMVTDSTGKITYAPNNLVTYSEQFDNAAWVKTGATVTANATTAPNGTLTADKMIGTGSNPFMSTSVFIAGTKYVYSLYAKASELNWIRLTNGSAGINSAWFNVSTGTVGTIVGSGNTATITSVGNGWYRCVFVVTAANSVTGGAVIACTNADNTTSGYTGNSVDGVFIWGAQLEAVTYQTSPSTYVPTTASAYYGPRFDYDPVTLASKGLLIEEQRANLLTYSEQVDNAAWLKSNLTVTANATTAPDGTTTADLCTPTAAGYLIRTTTTVSGTTYAKIVYLKSGGTVNLVNLGAYAGPNAATVNFDVLTGTFSSPVSLGTGVLVSYTATNVGNGWYRISIVFSGINNAILQYNPVYNVAQSGGVYVWGAQLEAGSFATSYIPTVASSVTRSADIASMTGSNFSSWYSQGVGTLVVNFIPDEGLVSDANRIAMISRAGSTGRVVDIYTQVGNWVNFNGSANMVMGSAVVSNSVQKIAVAFAEGNYAAVLNGASPATSTLATVNVPDQLQIGNLAGTLQANARIQSIRYYRTRLPNNILQQLTR